MKCNTCKTTKNLLKTSVSTNGRVQYMCRECNVKKMKKYTSNTNGRNRVNEASYRSIDKYRYKHNARVLVYQAIKRGELCKPNKCENCFKSNEIFAHHDDYSKPLEVAWLCRNCHILIHKK